MPDSTTRKPLPQKAFLRVAVPVPLRRLFDYRMPSIPVYRGQRIRIPFGKRQLLGIAIDSCDRTEIDPDRVLSVTEVLSEAMISEDILDLLLWASGYYHHPPGEALVLALPPSLRRRKSVFRKSSLMDQFWQATPDAPALPGLRRAPRQQAVLEALMRSSRPLDGHALKATSGILRKLLDKHWITPVEPLESGLIPEQPLVLNQEQADSLKAIHQAAGSFQCLLLEGVTGSGKTEVYLQAIDDCLERGLQALVMIPEIGLTSQLRSRFELRFPGRVGVIHSGIPEKDRRTVWFQAAEGRLSVLLGTRTALFTPLPRLGLIVIDEEHDGSYRQGDGFRYSARDLAVKYAGQRNIPVILGSATPALETIANVALKGYRHLRLSQRPKGIPQPRWRIADLRSLPESRRLADFTAHSMEQQLAAGNQVLFFVNRRGLAPVLMCKDCGWCYDCVDCDARMVLHRRSSGLYMLCHHCGAQTRVPGQCALCKSASLIEVGAGTQKFEAELQQRFPDYELLRIDSDVSPARRTELFSRICDGRSQILVGTNMLTKGHDFPHLTLTVIANADAGLFSPDFRAPERISQAIIQVAGRAGRSSSGEVIIQTRHPDHPLLLSLLREGYGAFARKNLQERLQHRLPPYAHLAVFRAEARVNQAARRLLMRVVAYRRQNADEFAGVELWGPIAPAMEKKFGRFHQQLVLCADSRRRLHRVLGLVIQKFEAEPQRSVRWSVEVDPFDLY